MDLVEYTALVESVMRDTQNNTTPVARAFENFGTDHARVVLTTMVRAARRDVFVFCGSLAADAFDADVLRDFLDSNPTGELRVLVQNKDVFTSPTSAIYGMRDRLGDRLEVRHTDAKMDHFTVVDAEHVRLEVDHDERKARVIFGNKQLGQQAKNLFNSLWQLSTPLE